MTIGLAEVLSAGQQAWKAVLESGAGLLLLVLLCGAIQRAIRAWDRRSCLAWWGVAVGLALFFLAIAPSQAVISLGVAAAGFVAKWSVDASAEERKRLGKANLAMLALASFSADFHHLSRSIRERKALVERLFPVAASPPHWARVEPVTTSIFSKQSVELADLDFLFEPKLLERGGGETFLSALYLSELRAQMITVVAQYEALASAAQQKLLTAAPPIREISPTTLASVEKTLGDGVTFELDALIKGIDGILEMWAKNFPLPPGHTNGDHHDAASRLRSAMLVRWPAKGLVLPMVE